MSTISCLVFVLLCSFHACCNARSLGVVNKEPTQEFHLKRQENDGKYLNEPWVSIQHDKISSPHKVSEGDEVIGGSSESKDRGNMGDAKARGDQIQVSDAALNEPLASVSWRVPNKKREDPEPGFNFDYLPPQTHPPSHN